MLTDAELCKALDVSTRLTAEWRKDKKITFIKIGAKIYYRYSEVLTFAEEHEVQAISQKRKF